MFHCSSIFALLGVFHIRGPHRKKVEGSQKVPQICGRTGAKNICVQKGGGKKIPKFCGRHICMVPYHAEQAAAINTAGGRADGRTNRRGTDMAVSAHATYAFYASSVAAAVLPPEAAPSAAVLALNATQASPSVRALLSDADASATATAVGTIFMHVAHFEKSKKQFESNRRGIGTGSNIQGKKSRIQS